MQYNILAFGTMNQGTVKQMVIDTYSYYEKTFYVQSYGSDRQIWDAESIENDRSTPFVNALYRKIWQNIVLGSNVGLL